MPSCGMKPTTHHLPYYYVNNRPIVEYTYSIIALQAYTKINGIKINDAQNAKKGQKVP